MTEPVVLDAPSAAPSAPTGPLADLILVRLLTEKGSLGTKKLRTDLAGFFRRPPTDEQFAAARDGLRDAGLVAVGGRGGMTLTEAGRARAMEYLGTERMPPKANWGKVKVNLLVPKALGLSPASDEAKALSDSKTFLPRLLKRQLGLPVGTKATVTGVMEALACRELGFPELATVKSLSSAAFARHFDSPEPLDRDAAWRLLPGRVFGANGSTADAVRTALLAKLGDGAAKAVDADTRVPITAPEEEPFDLEVFANTVRAAARASTTGRFGDNKVFISHVWRQLTAEPPFAALGPDGFKRKLVEANQQGLLTLSRADLVHLMDTDDVSASETAYLNATYHFVTVEG